AIAAMALTVRVLTQAPAIQTEWTGRHPISGRVFAPVMGAAGADWLDRSERETEEAPERALDIIDIKKGSTVADIGAGSGYMTVRMAARVGPSGKVYANDIQAAMLAKLRRRLADSHITN